MNNKCKTVVWQGGTECNYCHKPIHGILHDAKTLSGFWATMCDECAKKHRKYIDDGYGSGQTYHESNGEFIYRYP